MYGTALSEVVKEAVKEAMKNEKDNNMGGDFVVVDRPGTLDGEGEVPKLLPKGIAKGGAKTKAPGAGLGPKKILEGPAAERTREGASSAGRRAAAFAAERARAG